MISSVITLRLKRRNALSIDSLLLTDTKATSVITLPFALDYRSIEQTKIKHFFHDVGKFDGYQIE